VTLVAVQTGWKFAEAKESHLITEKLVNNGFKLEGKEKTHSIVRLSPSPLHNTHM
jgi:hypothetical protein